MKSWITHIKENSPKSLANRPDQVGERISGLEDEIDG
jgi:hypothetical protein